MIDLTADTNLSRSRFRDWLMLVLCNLIWASQFAMVKLVQAQLGPASATFLPMALATLLLVPVVYREGRKNAPCRFRTRMSVPDAYNFLLLGILGQVGAQLFITWGVQLSLASNAALLTLALPISTAVIAYLVLGERMTVVRWFSFLLAITGVLECSGVAWGQVSLVGSKYFVGNCLIFLSVNGSAFFNVYSKKMLIRYRPLEVLLYSNCVFVAVMFPITLYTEPQVFRNLLHLTTQVWVGLIVLALLQYFLSMVIFLTVLTRLEATQAGLANYLIPFFGVVIAALFLRERPTPFMLMGGLLVLSSTLLMTLYEERHRFGRPPDLAQ